MGDTQVAEGVLSHPQPLAAHRTQLHLPPFELHFARLSLHVELHQHPAPGGAAQGGCGAFQPQNLSGLAIYPQHLGATRYKGFSGGGAVQWGDHNDCLVVAAQAQLQSHSGHGALRVGAQGGVIGWPQKAGVGIPKGVEH